MPYWVDITDTPLAAGKPPTSELANALRERDKCNASKPCGVETDSIYTNVTANFEWRKYAEYRVFVPDDVPDGWRLFMPMHYDATSGGGTAKYKLGSNESPELVPLAGYGFTVLAVDVDPSLRGTEVECELWAYTESYDVDPLTVFKVKGPGTQTQCLASFRRKPASDITYTINLT